MKACDGCAYYEECDGSVEWEVKQWDTFDKRIKEAKTQEEKNEAMMDRTDWVRKLG